MRNLPVTTFAEIRSLTLDFARLGPIEWHPDVPRGLYREFESLLDQWEDAKRDDPRADQHHAYLRAISA